MKESKFNVNRNLLTEFHKEVFNRREAIKALYKRALVGAIVLNTYFNKKEYIDSKLAYLYSSFAKHCVSGTTLEMIIEREIANNDFIGQVSIHSADDKKLVALILDDYQSSRVFELKGWILSRTECVLCALT
jgi:hypothetical protein